MTLSPRDALIGDLLAVDRGIQLCDSCGASDDDIAALAQVVEDLVGLWQDDLEDHGATLGFIYGVPDWLASCDGPLQVLVERLRTPIAELTSTWTALIKQIWEADDGSLHSRETNDIEMLREQLAESGTKGALERFRDSVFGDVPPSLTAATTKVDDPPSILDLMGSAESLIAARGAEQRDLGWRRIRIDVPVVHGSGSEGVLIGLEAWFPDFDQPAPTLAQPVCKPVPPVLSGNGASTGENALCMDNSFRRGVENGHRAAWELLRRLGDEFAARRIERMMFRLVGVRWPATVTDRSAGLPVALHVLAVAAALPRPPCIATGEIDGESLDLTRVGKHEEVAAKLRAVQRDGVVDRLAFHTRATRLSKEAGVLALSAPSLEAAAAKVWGESWKRWQRGLVVRQLERDGFACGWTHELPGAPPVEMEGEEIRVPFGDDNAATRLLDAYREGAAAGKPVKAVLGGWAGSGKTWMARWIGEQLCANGETGSDRPWQVCWISPSSESMGQALESGAQKLIDEVGLLLLGTSGPRRLVIVEDLEATEESTDLARLVNGIAEDHHVHVLALARFNRLGGLSWQTDGILVHSALYGAQVEAFAQRLIDSYPKLRPAHPIIPLALKAAGSSLDLLIRFLIEFGTELEVADEATLRHLIGKRVSAYSRPEEIAAIERLAAMSCLRLTTDASDLEALSEEELDRLWARRRPIGSRRWGWYIPSFYLSRELVAAEPSGHTVERFKARLVVILTRLIQEAIKRGDDRHVTTLLTGARRYSDVIYGRLLTGASRDLLDWTKQASPRSVAFFLRRCGRMLRPEDRALVTERLVQKVSIGIDAFGVSELAICLKQIRGHDHLLAHRRDQPDLFVDLEQKVRRGIPRVLADDRLAGPDARLGLMRQIDGLGFESGDAILLENYQKLLAGLRPGKPRHYRVLGEAIALLSQIASNFNLHFNEGLLERVDPVRPGASPADSDALASAHGGMQSLLSWLPGVRALLAVPGPKMDAGVYLGWLGLEAALEPDNARQDWRPVIEKVEGSLIQSLQDASAGEVAVALNGLAERRRVMAIYLLGNSALIEPLRACLFRSSPSESAALLGTLRNIRPRTAWLILRRTRGDTSLCATMAERIHGWNDAKGAGQLLSNAAAVDEIYGSPAKGFAHDLAERIGPEFARRALEEDPRTSVVFYLTAGLVAAAADYLPDLLAIAADRIVENIEADSRAWAPRLALGLISDDVLGIDPATAEEFLARLSRALRPGDGARSVLFRRMTEADEPQALAAFHDLAAALDYPERALAIDFADNFKGDADWVRVALGRDASRTAQACRAIMDTLRRGGIGHPGKMTMRVLEQNGWSWPSQLANLRAEQLATALRVISMVDRPTAEQTVNQLDQQRTGSGRRPSRARQAPLVDRVWGAPPGASLSLLSTLEEIRPGRGKELLAEFSTQKPPGRWKGRLRDLRFVSDPQEWSLNYVRLAALDFIPSATERRELWGRWSKGIDHIRSPRAASALIRAYATWPDRLHMAQEAAQLLNLNAIAERVTEGALPDLEAVDGLIGTLAAIGLRPEARRIAAGLADLEVARRLTPSACARLLNVLRDVDHSAAMSLGNDANDVIDRAIERQRVVRPSTHWLSIGWLAYELAVLGKAHRATLAHRPATLPTRHAAAMLWGTAWLNGDDWLHEASQEAIAFLARGPIAFQPNYLCLCLAGASHLGQADRVVAAKRSWAAALHAGPKSLTVLAECAEEDPAVLTALRHHRKQASSAIERMARPENRARFSCASALRALPVLS